MKLTWEVSKEELKEILFTLKGDPWGLEERIRKLEEKEASDAL